MNKKQKNIVGYRNPLLYNNYHNGPQTFRNFLSNALAPFTSAFSLVELSIVLIIIGLLIGAVIGGKTLVVEAKIKVIMKEFETILIAIQQYENIPESDENRQFCNSVRDNPTTFVKLKNLGLIDKHKYIQYGSSNPWSPRYQGYLSKIKDVYGTHVVWSNEYCDSYIKNKNNKTMKLHIAYGLCSAQKNSNTDAYDMIIPGAYYYTFDPKLCLKLRDKLRSRYGENVNNSQESTNMFFECSCSGKTNTGYNCTSDQAYKGKLSIYIYNI